MDSKFGASAAAGNDDDERRMLIAMWIRDNYAQMDEIEKFVAYYKYISPMLGFACVRSSASLEPTQLSIPRQASHVLGGI